MGGLLTLGSFVSFSPVGTIVILETNCSQVKTFPQIDVNPADEVGLTQSQRNHRSTIQGTEARNTTEQQDIAYES